MTLTETISTLETLLDGFRCTDETRTIEALTNAIGLMSGRDSKTGYDAAMNFALNQRNRRLQREINNYAEALTRSVSLPKGALPFIEGKWYCVMMSGQVKLYENDNYAVEEEQ